MTYKAKNEQKTEYVKRKKHVVWVCCRPKDSPRIDILIRTDHPKN